MRIAIVFILALTSLACSKKQAAAPPEAESAAEAPNPEATAAENAEAVEEVPPSLKKDLENIQLVELPEELKGETPAIGAPPTMKIIEPGAAPRTALRFDIAPGFKQKAAMDVGYAVDAVVVVMAIRNPQYDVSFDLSMRTKKAKGAVLVSFDVEGAKLDATKQNTRRREMLEKALKGAQNLSGSYRLTARGQITDLTVKVSKNATQESHDMADNLRVALLQMTPALPKEPVGIGATWTAHEGILQGGVHVNQLRSFELVSLENGVATLEVELEQSAAPQPYENPGKPMPLKLQVFSADGESALAWDFTRLTPVSADISSTSLKGIRQMVVKDGVPQAADAAVQSTRTVHIGPKQKP